MTIYGAMKRFSLAMLIAAFLIPAAPAFAKEPTTYIIVTRPMFTEALQPFIAEKNAKGEIVEMVTVEEIMAAYRGADIPEKIRRYLADEARVSPADTLLLVGAVRGTNFGHESQTELKTPWEVPIRYVEHLGEYAGPKLPIPTDQYYASAIGAWNPDEYFDFSVDFVTGRVPAKMAEDVSVWVEKTLAWKAPTRAVQSQFISAYCDNRSIPIQSDALLARHTHDMRFHYCLNDAGGDIAEIANQTAPDYISSYSHGNYLGTHKNADGSGYELTVDSPGFRNNPFVFIHGCDVGGLDYGRESLAEKLIRTKDGAVAFVGSSRSHWDMRFPFWQSVFLDGNLEAGRALYAAKQKQAAGLPSLKEMDNLLMFNLLGDPQLKLVEPAFATEELSSTYSDNGRIRYVTTRTTSLGPRAEGTVSQHQSSTAAPILVEAVKSATAVTAVWNRASADSFSQETVLGFTACDTSKHSCIAAPILLTAPVEFACARKHHENGQYAFDVKFLKGTTKELTLRLEGKGGMLSVDKPWSEHPWTHIESATTFDPIGSQMTTITFDKKLEDMHLASATDSVYYTPFYRLIAEDSAGNHLGSCALSNLGEPTFF